MKLLPILLLLTACGSKISLEGETTSRVEGTATVRVVVGIDATPCEGLEPAAKAECIQSLIGLAKVLQQTKDKGVTGE